jgi:hypothetical protein
MYELLHCMMSCQIVAISALDQRHMTSLRAALTAVTYQIFTMIESTISHSVIFIFILIQLAIILMTAIRVVSGANFCELTLVAAAACDFLLVHYLFARWRHRTQFK